MGPVCYSRYLQRQETEVRQGKFADIYLGNTGNGDIVLKRVNGVPATNVPHRQVRHSPTGYEWGYAGSGPADLALNILLMFTDEQTAETLHQDFKQEYITVLPEEGGIITRNDILHWIAKKAGTFQLKFVI
jgi:hypothetical protein